MLVHVIGFTPKGSVVAEGFDPRSLRQLIITDSQIDSKSHAPKSISLYLQTWPLVHRLSSQPLERETATQSPSRVPLVT